MYSYSVYLCLCWKARICIVMWEATPCVYVQLYCVFVSVLEGQSLGSDVRGHALCLMHSCVEYLYLCWKARVWAVMSEATLCILYVVILCIRTCAGRPEVVW